MILRPKTQPCPLPPQHQPTGRSAQADITVFIQASRRCQIRFTCWTPLLAALARNQFVQFLNWEKPLHRPILTPSNPRSVDVTKFQILAERIPLHGSHEQHLYSCPDSIGLPMHPNFSCKQNSLRIFTATSHYLNTTRPCGERNQHLHKSVQLDRSTA